MKGAMEGFLVRGFIIAGMRAGLVFATTPVFARGADNGDSARVYSSDHKGDGHGKGSH